MALTDPKRFKRPRSATHRTGFHVWEGAVPHWHATITGAKDRLKTLQAAGSRAEIWCCRCKTPVPCKHVAYGEW